MRIYILFFVSSLLSLPASAVNCSAPPQAIQKNEILKAIQNTEQVKVHEIDITAPGLAVVGYGNKGNKAIVTFDFRCSVNDDAESIKNNPTGFHVVSYSPTAR